MSSARNTPNAPKALGAREAAMRALVAMERAASYSGAAINRQLSRAIKNPARSLSPKTGNNAKEIEKSDASSIYVINGTARYIIDPEETDVIPDESLDARDRALFRELVYGVTRWKLTLDHIIFSYSSINRSRISQNILNILRLGAYQIIFLEKIPVPAACDECVKLAKKYGNEGSVRYVNALMRKIAAESHSAATAMTATVASKSAAEAATLEAAAIPAVVTAATATTAVAMTTTEAPTVTTTDTTVEEAMTAAVVATTAAVVTGTVAAEAAMTEAATLAETTAATMTNRYRIIERANNNRNQPQYSPSPPDAEQLSVYYSYPVWICERWLSRYGRDFTEALMDAGNQRPELSIRVNTMRASPADLTEKLKARGFDIESGRYSENALIVKNPADFTGSPEFIKGMFTVQDESSMLAAEALGARAGEKIMDICAAPGGKCCYIAEKTYDQTDILAVDLRQHRLALMEQNIKRLGLKSINNRSMDAVLFDARLENTMDKVLLDPPCSGLGVIRRKPEIKWTKHRHDIEAFATVQHTMLENAARYVKPGGTLVYSVCTIEPEECGDIIMGFLHGNTDFTLEDPHTYLPPEILGNKNFNQDTGFYIYPHIHGIDGFYIARLKRL